MTPAVPSLRSSVLSVSTLWISLLVLDRVAVSLRPIGSAELATQINLPRPTIHRILKQLAGVGLILRAPQRDRYYIGPEMMRLSALSLASMNAQPPTRAILPGLVDERSEARRVGKEGVSTCRSRWSRVYEKKINQ